MIEFEIQNFQSIKRTKLKVDGFAALVGRSNVGKSAIVRALRCCLTGASGTDFVRHASDCPRRTQGKKKCKCFASVDIHFPAMRVLWEKGDAVNQYTVWKDGAENPDVYSAVNRGAPDFLLPLFEPVKIGDHRDLIQVAEQFEPIFLLNQGGTTIADVLSDVANLDEINKAVSLASKDRKAAASTRKIREKDISSLDKDLERYAGLDGVVSRGSDIEARYEAIETAQERVLRLDRYRKTLSRVLLSIQSLKAATKPSVPDTSDVRAMHVRAAKADDLLQRVRALAPEIRKLRGIKSVRELDSDPLRAAYAKAKAAEGWIQRLRTFKDSMSRIKAAQAKPVPDKTSVEEARGRYEHLDSLWTRRTHLQEEQARLDAELQETVEQEKAVLDEFRAMGMCPTCSQDITADHCLHLGEE